jgi:alpha-D-ribose 1-methylphosphonate 5-triphosphate synthase subunit PhnH
MRAIQAAFTDPVQQAQQVFRRVLDAMARPGHICQLTGLPQAAPGLSPAATALCLTLTDFETPLWLDAGAGAARDYLVFHCSAPVTEHPDRAAFALVADASALNDFSRFSRGSDEYPETSCTLVIEVGELDNRGGMALAGPGIRDAITLGVAGVAANFWQQIEDNHGLFPRGVDLILCCGDRIAALPRSVRLIDGGN